MNNANSQVASLLALFLAGQRLSGSCCRQRRKWDGLKITRSADQLPPTVDVNWRIVDIPNMYKHNDILRIIHIVSCIVSKLQYDNT